MNTKLACTYGDNNNSKLNIQTYIQYKPDLDLLALPFGVSIETDKDGGYFLKIRKTIIKCDQA